MGETRAALAKPNRNKPVARATTAPNGQKPRSDSGAQLAAVALVVILGIVAVVRLRLLDLPLERDEGEYAYAGQLLLQGIAPYKLVYNMKFPGTYAAYALLMGIFGQSAGGIRIGLLLVTSATTLLLYFLTARFFGRTAGVVAAATQALLSVSLTSMGPYAHATHFVAFFSVGGLLLLIPRPKPLIDPAKDRRLPRLLGAGAMLALAVLMKQPGATFAIFAIIWLLLPASNASARTSSRPFSTRLRDAALVTGGGVAVAALTAIALAAAGVFRTFWFWTVDYARTYAANSTFTDGGDRLRESLGAMFGAAPLVWIIAICGLVLLFIEPTTRRHWTFVIGLLAASIVAVLPGFYFRPHYFLLAFPAVGMLAGVAVAATARLIGARSTSPFAQALPAAVFAVAFLAGVGGQWSWLMESDPLTITRSLFGYNPFAEAPSIADAIRRNTSPEDRIAVFGSEPELNFLADRKGATGYIYMYPLMENQAFAATMQRQMIEEVEKANPKYIVMVSTATSWLSTPASNPLLFQWIQQKISTGYALDGIVEILPNGQAQSAWGAADAKQYKPRSRNIVMLFRRTT